MTQHRSPARGKTTPASTGGSFKTHAHGASEVVLSEPLPDYANMDISRLLDEVPDAVEPDQVNGLATAAISTFEGSGYREQFWNPLADQASTIAAESDPEQISPEAYEAFLVNADAIDAGIVAALADDSPYPPADIVRAFPDAARKYAVETLDPAVLHEMATTPEAHAGIRTEIRANPAVETDTLVALLNRDDLTEAEVWALLRHTPPAGLAHPIAFANSGPMRDRVQGIDAEGAGARYTPLNSLAKHRLIEHPETSATVVGWLAEDEDSEVGDAAYERICREVIEGNGRGEYARHENPTARMAYAIYAAPADDDGRARAAENLSSLCGDREETVRRAAWGNPNTPRAYRAGSMAWHGNPDERREALADADLPEQQRLGAYKRLITEGGTSAPEEEVALLSNPAFGPAALSEMSAAVTLYHPQHRAEATLRASANPSNNSDGLLALALYGSERAKMNVALHPNADKFVLGELRKDKRFVETLTAPERAALDARYEEAR